MSLKVFSMLIPFIPNIGPTISKRRICFFFFSKLIPLHMISRNLSEQKNLPKTKQAQNNLILLKTKTFSLLNDYSLSFVSHGQLSLQ